MKSPGLPVVAVGPAVVDPAVSSIGGGLLPPLLLFSRSQPAAGEGKGAIFGCFGGRLEISLIGLFGCANLGLLGTNLLGFGLYFPGRKELGVGVKNREMFDFQAANTEFFKRSVSDRSAPCRNLYQSNLRPKAEGKRPK